MSNSLETIMPDPSGEPGKKKSAKMRDSIKIRIGQAFGAAIASLALVGGVALYMSFEMGKSIQLLQLNTSALKRQALVDMLHDNTRGNALNWLVIAQSNDPKSEREGYAKEASEGYAKNKKDLFDALNENAKTGTYDDNLAAMSREMIPDFNALMAGTERMEKGSRELVARADTIKDDERKELVTKLDDYFHDEFTVIFKRLEKKGDALFTAMEEKSKTIQARADELRTFSLIAEGASAGIGLLAITLMISILFKNLNAKLEATLSLIAKIKQGELDGKYTLPDDDEFQLVGKSLELMATDIRSLQNKNADLLVEAEAENKELNDSIVELLGTMFALTKKDFTVKAEVTENVVGTIADSINMVIRSTNDAMSNTAQIANMVSEASHESQEKSNQIFELSRRSKVNVEDVLTNFEKSLAEIKMISSVAKESKAAADQATESTSAALAIVKQTVSSMGSIRDTISNTETKIKKLAERSQEIGFIVELIGDISERTHVLALNATIQAAVAGDAGRGFAAIAEEIQKLAENTKEATNKIARLVENIQVETSDTIQLVNQTIDKVVGGVKLAESSGAQMAETQGKTGELAEAVRRISDSIADHELLTGDMKTGAEVLGAAQDEFSTAAQDQLMRARSLMMFSKQLQSTVDEFKLE